MIALDLAKQFASRSLHPKHRHAAVIFHDGEVVAISNNTRREHAEIRAIKIAHIYGYYNNLTLLSVAITKVGRFKLAKPCANCEIYCKINGIKNILYSTNKQTFVRMK